MSGSAQVRLRAERTGALHDELFLAAETDLPPGFAARPVLGDAEWRALQTICN